MNVKYAGGIVYLDCLFILALCAINVTTTCMSRYNLPINREFCAVTIPLSLNESSYILVTFK